MEVKNTDGLSGERTCRMFFMAGMRVTWLSCPLFKCNPCPMHLNPNMMEIMRKHSAGLSKAKTPPMFEICTVCPLDRGAPFSVCETRTVCSSVFFLFNFLTTQHVSLSHFVFLFPHFLLTPKGKKRISVSSCFAFTPSSWEGGRRCRWSHGPQ